ncbi:hypothetical protein ACO0QE_003785 [Hanseniaspora vineae]
MFFRFTRSPLCHNLACTSQRFTATSSPSETNPKLVVITALGNPPDQYANTRHNAGHVIFDSLIPQLVEKNTALLKNKWRNKSYSLSYFLSPKPQNETAKTSIQYMFVKVDGCFMNLSGQVLLPFWKSSVITDWQKSNRAGEIQHIVVHDELEKPLGECQWRKFGTSAKGHNGLRSIDSCNASAKKGHSSGVVYSKIGIGIDRPPKGEDIANYVLSRFSRVELETLQRKTVPNAFKLLKIHGLA